MSRTATPPKEETPVEPFDPSTGVLDEAQAASRLAEDPMDAIPDIDPSEYDEQELEDSYIKLTITAGRKCEEPGTVHLQNPGDNFIGLYEGEDFPRGFDRPVLIFRIGGQRHRAPYWESVVDKLRKTHDETFPGRMTVDMAGKTVDRYLTLGRPSKPVLVRIRYDGTEKLDGGKTIHRFFCSELVPKKRR